MGKKDSGEHREEVLDNGDETVSDNNNWLKIVGIGSITIEVGISSFTRVFKNDNKEDDESETRKESSSDDATGEGCTKVTDLSCQESSGSEITKPPTKKIKIAKPLTGKKTTPKAGKVKERWMTGEKIVNDLVK